MRRSSSKQLGRGLVPGPLVATHLAASVLRLDGAADGTLVVGDARPDDPCLVEHLDSLDALVVDRPAGVAVVDGAALTAVVDAATPVERSLDPLTPLSVVAELPDGRPVDADTAQRWTRDHRA